MSSSFPVIDTFFIDLSAAIILNTNVYMSMIIRTLLLYFLQLTVFTIFTVNFLNIRSAKIQRRGETKGLRHLTTEPLIDRLVFIVIDALRSDFVFSPDSPMSFTKGLMKAGLAQGFIAKATTPTVTLPRLKALTAGTPPVFFDFLANLDEKSDMQKDDEGSDSWVKQLYIAGKRMVFLGDDTWLRLFPKHYFTKIDPTTSFFVKVHIKCL
jgi:ethanolaminephosphotransferase